jgi:hypothetical protein
MADGNEIAPEGEAPERHDQAFFLDLAAQGKDAWEQWRRDPANKDVRVTVRGHNFLQTPVNFEGFDLGPGVDFTGRQFGNDANFTGMCFGT